jgi:hypothetical protein
MVQPQVVSKRSSVIGTNMSVCCVGAEARHGAHVAECVDWGSGLSSLVLVSLQQDD